MLRETWFRVAMGVAVAAAYVLAGGAFLTTERNYMGYLERGNISTTVDDYAVVETANETVLQVEVTVHNPTAARVQLDGVRTVSAYIPGDQYPTGRVADAIFEDAVVPPDSSRQVELTIDPTDGIGPIRQAVNAGELVLSGNIVASIGNKQIDIRINTGAHDE